MIVKYKVILAQKQTRGLLAVSLLTMLTIGIVYIWSVFILPLEQEFVGARNEISLVFTVAMASMSLGTAFGGFIHRRLRVETLLALLITLIAVSVIIASYSSSLQIITVFYGAVFSLCVGITYNLIIYKCNQAFSKEIAATVSGALQSFVAVGTVFFAYLAAYMLEFYDWRIAIRVLGGGLVICLIYSSKFLCRSFTGADEAGAGESSYLTGLNSRQMLATRNFWFFICIRISLLSCGIGLIGHTVPIAVELGVTPDKAILALSLFSFCNALGKALFGIIWDCIGPRKTIMAVMFFCIASFGLLVASSFKVNIYTVFTAFALGGFSYGGTILLSAAFSRTFFGLKYFSENFGLVSISMVIASFIGPPLLGEAKLLTGTYISGLLILAVFNAATLALLPFISEKNN